METLDGHKRLGRLIKERRKAREWTLENVSAQVRRMGLRLSPQHLSNIENAYNHPGKEPSTPPDELLRALSEVLSTSISEFHAALGRHKDSAASLIREQLSEVEGAEILPPEALEELEKDVAKYARWEVERMMSQYQRQSQAGGGKQVQKQKQEKAAA